MYRIGIDLGGTNIACGIVDDNKNILGSCNLKTKKAGEAAQIIDDIIEGARLCANSAGICFDEVEFCGVGVPGWVDKENGFVVKTTNLNLSETPLVEILEKNLGIKCALENDANAAAIGECIAGAGKGCKDFIVITLGTGVGSGIIINGKIISGVNSAASEFGHIVIKYDGLPCPCGRRGCYEQYASVSALIRQTKEAMLNNKDSIMWQLCENNLNNVSGRTSFNAMRNGDSVAKKVVHQYIEFISVGVVDLINTFQPELICLAGGISREGEYILAPLREIVNKYRFSHKTDKQTKLCNAVLGNDAGIIGAAFCDTYID